MCVTVWLCLYSFWTIDENIQFIQAFSSYPVSAVQKKKIFFFFFHFSLNVGLFVGVHFSMNNIFSLNLVSFSHWLFLLLFHSSLSRDVFHWWIFQRREHILWVVRAMHIIATIWFYCIVIKLNQKCQIRIIGPGNYVLTMRRSFSSLPFTRSLRGGFFYFFFFFCFFSRSLLFVHCFGILIFLQWAYMVHRVEKGLLNTFIYGEWECEQGKKTKFEIIFFFLSSFFRKTTRTHNE